VQEVTPEPGPAQEVVFSRQTAVRLGRAIRNVATSEVGTRAAALGGLLLAFLFTINALNVVNSYVGRYFMTALERRDSHEFVRQALFYVGLFAASTIAAVLYRFTEERLGLLWREWLTHRLVGMYLAGQVFYRVEVTGTLGNADQRIADDVRSFTTSTLSLFLIFLNGAITMLAFSGVLWSISRLLFVVAMGYAALGSLCAVVLGRPLVRLNYDQADREANFRNELVHVRQNAEAVVLSHREAHFGARLQQHVGAFTGNFKRIIAVNRNLGFFTTGYNYLIQIIPVLIVGPLFIRGTVEFGVIPQASMAFVHVLGAFSLVVTQFPSLSSYAAVLARLSALAESTEAIAARGAGGIAVAEGDQPRLAIEGLTLRAPQDGRVLVRDLSVDVRAGARLLVTAPNDVVLAALQRAIVGIWESGDGRIVRPRLDDVLLLPDRPYLPPGTLRELVVGIDLARPVPDDRIWETLRLVGVDSAVRRVGGLEGARDWRDVLSLEEQLLVGVTRLLLAAPHFAVLAPLAPSLGTDRAADILAALAERGVGYVVLGDGALSSDLFDAIIDIGADGTWTHTPTKEVPR
jgi:vitamin B12/bleomycin/antimicrobial peptide transport system ATP-binding/permease protein